MCGGRRTSSCHSISRSVTPDALNSSIDIISGGREVLQRAVQVKSIWIPYGE